MKTLANVPMFTKSQVIGLVAVALVLIALVVAVSFGDFSGMDNVQFIN